MGQHRWQWCTSTALLAFGPLVMLLCPLLLPLALLLSLPELIAPCAAVSVVAFCSPYCCCRCCCIQDTSDPCRHTYQLSQLSQSAVRAAACCGRLRRVRGGGESRAWHADRQSVRERRGVEAEQPAPLITAHWSQRQYIAAGQSSEWIVLVSE